MCECDNCQLDKTENKTAVPYQIHISVDFLSDFDKFRDTCHELNIKPIKMFNILDSGELATDIFTSSYSYEEYQKVLEIAASMFVKMLMKDLKAKRIKVETPCWNPIIKTIIDDHKKNPSDIWYRYFESHLTVEGDSSVDFNKFGAKKSTKYPETNVFYLTQRASIFDIDAFNEKFEALQKELLNSNYNIKKARTEFIMIDSCPELDNLWFSKG